MKITIEIGADELVDAIARLAGALAPAKQPPAGPLWGPFSDGVTIAQLDPAGELEFLQKTSPPRTPLMPAAPAPAVEPEPAPVQMGRPLARNGFTYTPAPTPASAPLAPEPLRPAIKKPTAEQRLAASKVGADLASKRRANGAAMEFEEFDALVKREVRRLAAGKTMPSHALWNEMRDPKLPTLSTVIARYGAGTAEELASLLGYNPSLRGIKPQQAADEETQAAEAVSA